VQSDRACALSSKADNDVELSNLLLLPLPRNASRALTIITEENVPRIPGPRSRENFRTSTQAIAHEQSAKYVETGQVRKRIHDRNLENDNLSFNDIILEIYVTLRYLYFFLM